MNPWLIVLAIICIFIIIGVSLYLNCTLRNYDRKGLLLVEGYKKLGEKGLDNYTKALKLGYTKSIAEIYETAGIKFDFSADYVKELADFIKDELSKLG